MSDDIVKASQEQLQRIYQFTENERAKVAELVNQSRKNIESYNQQHAQQQENGSNSEESGAPQFNFNIGNIEQGIADAMANMMNQIQSTQTQIDDNVQSLGDTVTSYLKPKQEDNDG